MTIVPEMEVSLGHHKYRIARLSAFDQLDVAADYRDILVGLAMMKKDRPKGLTDPEFYSGVQFIIASRAGMTPEVRGRVVGTCLASVQRHEGVGWQPILAADRQLQFADIELPVMTRLLYAVFDYNKLLDFFSAGPSSTDGQKDQTGQGSLEQKTG